jgi:RHS repeat-associated protein
MTKKTSPLRHNWRTHPRPASRHEPTDATTELLAYTAMVHDPFVSLCCQNARWLDPTPGRFLESPLFASSEENLYTTCGGEPVNPVDPLAT